MAAKSPLARGMFFGAEFFTDIYKALEKKGVSREEILEASEREFKTGSGLAEKVAQLIVSVKSEFLSLLSEGKELVIPSVDGTSLLSKASDVFSWINPDFTNWKLNEHGPSTDATSVEVFEMVKDGTFKDLFTSLSADLDSLCLTQSQIKEFCKTNRAFLRTDGYGTFFLFKREHEFFIACVSVGSVGRLRVGVRRFEDSRVWSANCRHHVVVPAGGG